MLDELADRRFNRDLSACLARIRAQGGLSPEELRDLDEARLDRQPDLQELLAAPK